MEIRSLRLKHRHDILVNQSLHKHGSLHIGKNTYHNADHNYNNMDPVGLKNIPHPSSKHLALILYHRA